MTGFLELPIDFGTLMQANKDLPTCELKMSIAQNINLIITSKYNEHRFDDTYGCVIWNMDFELVLNENAWREKVNQSVLQSLKKHEQRLEIYNTSVDMAEEEFVNRNTGIKGIRKRIKISVVGQVKETGEQYNFSTSLFLSPISFD